MLHVTCCAAPRDTFGRLLSTLEPADGLLMAVTLAPGETSQPLPAGGGLLTLSALVDGWVEITPQASEIAAPRRYLAAGSVRSFEAHPGLVVAWMPHEPARIASTPARTRRRAATA
jgi:hypothetical protein